MHPETIALQDNQIMFLPEEDGWEDTHVVYRVYGMLLNEKSRCTVFGEDLRFFTGHGHIRHPAFVLHGIMQRFRFQSAYHGVWDASPYLWGKLVDGLYQFCDSVTGDAAAPWIKSEAEVFRRSLSHIVRSVEGYLSFGTTKPDEGPNFGRFCEALWKLYGEELVESPDGILAQSWRCAPSPAFEREEPLSPPQALMDLL